MKKSFKSIGYILCGVALVIIPYFTLEIPIAGPIITALVLGIYMYINFYHHNKLKVFFDKTAQRFEKLLRWFKK